MYVSRVGGGGGVLHVVEEEEKEGGMIVVLFYAFNGFASYFRGWGGGKKNMYRLVVFRFACKIVSPDSCSSHVLYEVLTHK